MQFYMLVIYWCMARFKEQTEENWENNILDKAQFSFLENYDDDFSLVHSKGCSTFEFIP